MEFLKNISWIISSPVESAEKFEDDDIIELTDNELDKIIHNQSFKIKLPIHRYSLGYYEITIPKNTSVEKFLEIIYSFYNQQDIDYEIIKDFKDDCFNYIKDAKEELKKGKKLKWIELMGDLRYFEGIKKKDEEYYLGLGS